VLKPVSLVLLAVGGGTLAVIARAAAIYATPTVGRHRPVVRGGGAVGGRSLTVTGSAPRDLATRIIRIRGVARRQLEVTFDTNLIALGCGSIAPVGTCIAASGCPRAAHGAFAAFVRVTVARVAHQVMYATVAARHQIAIARTLVHGRGKPILVGGRLVGIGRGLLAVTPRLLGIRECLLAIGAPLIVSQAPDCGRVTLLLCRVPACQLSGTIA
jgi:predicted DNA-binding ribbon-helix-helix protein